MLAAFESLGGADFLVPVKTALVMDQSLMLNSQDVMVASHAHGVLRMKSSAYMASSSQCMSLSLQMNFVLTRVIETTCRERAIRFLRLCYVWMVFFAASMRIL
jgi:hypothetical protein